MVAVTLFIHLEMYKIGKTYSPIILNLNKIITLNKQLNSKEYMQREGLHHSTIPNSTHL